MTNSSGNTYSSESYEKGSRSIDLLLEEHDILNYLKTEVQKNITGEDVPIQIVLLSIFSALLLEKPFGVLVYSASSTGKSHLIKSVVDCFGPKFDGISQKGDDIEIKPGFGFVSANSLTLAGLTRLAKNNSRCFDKKVLLLHEINESTSEDVKQVTQALRQFVSDGSYDRILTNEQTKKPMRLRLEGWCACISECAEKVVEVQWGNRFLFINLDESEHQNKAIAEFQAQEYITPWNVELPNTELFWDICWYIQDDDFKARKIPLLNPWVLDITEYILSLYGSDTRIRRYLPVMLKAIETLSRLHYNQRQKLTHHSGMVVLTSKRWDNAKILSLFDEMLLHTLRNITSGALDLLRRIDANYTIKEDNQTLYKRWTVKDISKDLGMSYSSAKDKIRMLRNYGLIEHVDNEGRAYVYSLSETGKNFSLSGRHRTTSDMMIYLPDRDIETCLLPSVVRTQGMAHTPRPHHSSSISSVDVSPTADSLHELCRPLKSDSQNIKFEKEPTHPNQKTLNGLYETDGRSQFTSVNSDDVAIKSKFKIQEIDNYILKWLKNSENNELSIREIADMLKLNGYDRDAGIRCVDEMTRRGILFEEKQGIIRLP